MRSLAKLPTLCCHITYRFFLCIRTLLRAVNTLRGFRCSEMCVFKIWPVLPSRQCTWKKSLIYLEVKARVYHKWWQMVCSDYHKPSINLDIFHWSKVMTLLVFWPIRTLVHRYFRLEVQHGRQYKCSPRNRQGVGKFNSECTDCQPCCLSESNCA